MEISDLTNEQLEAEIERRKKKVKEPPKALVLPDYGNLKKVVFDYVASIQEPDYCSDNDWKQYIFEGAVEAYYGPEIWAWIRGILR